MQLRSQLITSLATLDNAKAYQESHEKFTFCLDLLEMSLEYDGDYLCDICVNSLEDKFDKLLCN